MKGNYRKAIFIALVVTLLFILRKLYLQDSSSIDALPSVKTLLPVYPYTRRSKIKHMTFEPDTFQQNSVNGFNFRKKLQEIIREKSDMYDMQMISIIRNYVIQKPELRQYKLVKEDLFDYSGGQSAEVDNILRFKENGFYVECCNTDGEKESSTLFFERVRKWNGLVITSSTKLFIGLKAKNRKAMIMNSCLSHSEYLVEKNYPGRTQSNQTMIFCFPLYSIMSALERKHIDFLALDVGGDKELSILQAIPFSKLNINMLTVRFKGEIRHFKSPVQLYLEDLGYDIVLKMVKGDESVHHLIAKKREESTVYYVLLRIVLCFVLILSFSIIIIMYIYISTYCQERQPLTLFF